MATRQAEPNVGQRIRELREQQGLSLRTLADKCGLSINAISRIERGANSPTVSSLHRLAMALEVPITELFNIHGRETTIYTPAGTEARNESDNMVIENLGSGLYNQQLEPFRIITQSKSGNFDDPITHPGQEFVHLISGNLEYKIGDETFTLNPGDSLLFEASQPHRWHNHGDTSAQMVIVIMSSEQRQMARRTHTESI